MTMSAELAEIDHWWTSGPRAPAARIAGSAYDQLTPAGVDNPYWEIVRQLPSVRDPSGLCPDGFTRELPVGHHLLTRRYAWAIPSPGDVGWLVRLLGGLGVAEIGAGSGYWAWQAHQAGIDVVAYEPADPAANTYTDGIEYTPLRRSDHAAAGDHPDRALLLCWPSRDDPWAAKALRAYDGGLLVYVGQGRGGHCADGEFFDLLDHAWTPAAVCPAHVGWHPTGSTMTAYRRA